MVTTVQERLRVRIKESRDAPAFDVLTFAAPATPVEIGTSLVTPAFTATYNRPPTFATLSDDDGNPAQSVISSPEAFNSVNTYQKTTPNDAVVWTLNAGDGLGADSEVDSVAWQARRFVGWTTDPGPYDEAAILALNQLTNALASGGLFDVTLNPDNAPGGAFLVAAYHDAFNGAVPLDFEIGDFGNGDVTEVQTGVAISIPGGSALYSIARSDLAIQAPGGIRFARES